MDNRAPLWYRVNNKWKLKWMWIFAYSSFWVYFGSCRQSETPFKLKMCLHFLILPELWLLKMEETHVSAHMFFVKSLMFIHNPCYYLVSRPVFSKYIFYLFLDSCSAYKFFNAWLVLIDYADVSCICKSFEPCISATNLCHAAFLQKVDWLGQLLHISWQD